VGNNSGQGRFVFLSLPPGTYTLTATLDGFKGYKASNIVLRSGDKVDVTVTLEAGAYQEEMEVRGVAPVVDTKASTIDTTFTAELLDKLPTARNAFYDLALTAPGIAAVGSDESWLPSPSAFGSAANENIFLVNGVNATNPRGAPWGSLVSVNYNTVEEVKVLSLGSKAEYGSFSGAAIDVMTKSGGNDFSGSAAFYSMIGNAADNYTDSFGDDLFFVDPDDDLTTTPEENWEASFAAGGPILRDKLWFYAGYARYGAETDTPLFEPLSTYDADLFDIKLTGELGGKHRAWLAYHTEDLTAGNNSWGQTWDATMRYDQPRDNDTLQFQYQWVVTDRDLTSFKYLGFKTEEHPSIPAETGSPGFINWWKFTGGQSIGLGGDFPYVEAQKSKRSTIQADYTHYAAEFLGTHEVKFGVQYTKSNGDWQGGYFHGFANFAEATGSRTRMRTVMMSSTTSQPTAMCPWGLSRTSLSTRTRIRTTVLATEIASPSTTPMGQVQPARTAIQAARAVATVIWTIAPGMAIDRTASRSFTWRWRPTPNIRRMTPTSASSVAIRVSATKPGV
jgi:hypothetical protein